MLPADPDAVYAQELDAQMAAETEQIESDEPYVSVKQKQQTESRAPEPPYTFEDIEPYSYVHLDGQRGWILDKGDHLAETNDPTSEHIMVQLVPDSENEEAEEKLLHERVVNIYLRDQRKLWVDFGNRIAPSGDS